MTSVNVATLLHHKGVELSLRCLASLVRFSAGSINFTIFDDGSLTPDDCIRLVNNLPVVRIVNRSKNEPFINNKLNNYPFCRKFRDIAPISLKLFDIPLTLGGVVSYCDSDILFIKPFKSLFSLPPGVNMLHMLDHINAATIRPWHINPLGPISLIERFNSGIMVFDSSFYSLDIIENFLAKIVFSTSVGKKRFCWTEQTCWAVLASSLISRFYDPLQFPIASPHIFNVLNSAIGIHFVTPQRHMINREEFINTPSCPAGHPLLPVTFPSIISSPSSALFLDIRQSMNHRYFSFINR